MKLKKIEIMKLKKYLKMRSDPKIHSKMGRPKMLSIRYMRKLKISLLINVKFQYRKY